MTPSFKTRRFFVAVLWSWSFPFGIGIVVGSLVTAVELMETIEAFEAPFQSSIDAVVKSCESSRS